MSGFEIVGVVLAVQPLVTQSIPYLRDVIKALVDSQKIKKEAADNILGLFFEFECTCSLLERFSHSTPSITHPNMAADFNRLFAEFEPAITKVLNECERLAQKSKISFAFSTRKFEEIVSELDRLLQRVSRRVTLLVCFIQQRLIDAPTVLGYVSKYDDQCPTNHRQTKRLLPKFQTQNTLSRGPGPSNDGSIVDIHQIPETHNVHLSVGRFSQRSGNVLIERRFIRSTLEHDAAREVAQKLSAASSNFPGILAYYDSKHDVAQNCWDIVYHYPPTAPPSSIPQTLLSVLPCDDQAGGWRSNQPLNVRLRLAKQIANAVLFVHIASLVHKNIRPETILIFGAPSRPSRHEDTLGDAFLVGFDKSRGNNGKTLGNAHHDDWDICIYCHPMHDGGPHTRYTMFHDIYALGVVLLQIGLWRSFVGPLEEIDEYEDDVFVRTVISRRPLYPFSEDPVSQKRIQEQLLDCAYDDLPCSMGFAYMDVVLSCLKCVDHSNSVIGAWFIEDVLDRLDEIKF